MIFRQTTVGTEHLDHIVSSRDRDVSVALIWTHPGHHILPLCRLWASKVAVALGDPLKEKRKNDTAGVRLDLHWLLVAGSSLSFRVEISYKFFRPIISYVSSINAWYMSLCDIQVTKVTKPARVLKKYSATIQFSAHNREGDKQMVSSRHAPFVHVVESASEIDSITN